MGEIAGGVPRKFKSTLLQTSDFKKKVCEFKMKDSETAKNNYYSKVDEVVN